MAKKTETPLATRVVYEDGASSGVVEFQLPGSKIASVSCSLRKEAWTQVPAQPPQPVPPNPPESGSNK